MISVIVPFFNAEKFLSDIINDLLMQTYSNMEIILINDGSTDKSGSIAQSFQLQDERIRYIKLVGSQIQNTLEF